MLQTLGCVFFPFFNKAIDIEQFGRGAGLYQYHGKRLEAAREKGQLAEALTVFRRLLPGDARISRSLSLLRRAIAFSDFYVLCAACRAPFCFMERTYNVKNQKKAMR